MDNDQLKTQMFCAACGLILVILAYCFICIWIPPKIDLTTPLFGMASLLVGYYYGTSKSSGDKDKTIDKQIQNAVDVAKIDVAKKE